MSPAPEGEHLHLISLSAVTWDFPLIGRTRMLTEAWHRLGYRTSFVEVPSRRTTIHLLRHGSESAGEPKVMRPWPILPGRSWRWIGEDRLERSVAWQARRLGRQLRRRSQGARSLAVVVSPAWTPWLEELGIRRIVYDCIDAVEVHVPRPELAPLFRRWEDRLVERASAAVTSAGALAEALRARRPGLPVATVRNGVDVEQFQHRARERPRPTDLPRSRSRTVGFVGALYDWIDWELVRAVARLLPQTDFVFVGPLGRGETPPREPNVRLLGARSYADVPSYVDAFDVCWVPFKTNRVGRLSNPVKIYEYLALGKPVVSSEVADTESFEGLITVAKTAEEHAAALCGGRGGGGDRSRRINFARNSSWERRAREYANVVEALS